MVDKLFSQQKLGIQYVYEQLVVIGFEHMLGPCALVIFVASVLSGYRIKYSDHRI